MTFTPGPWWKSYDLGTYEIRADGGVVVTKDCTKEDADAIASMPDMLAALRELAKAEAECREACEMFGFHDLETMRLWGIMLQAGDAAREVLKRIDGQEEPR